MSAADDYPAYGAIGGTVELHCGDYERMCAEIDERRALFEWIKDRLPRVYAPHGCIIETSDGWVWVITEPTDV